MDRLYFRSDNGLVNYGEYEKQITESAVAKEIKRTMELDEEFYSEDDIEEIAETTVEAFQSWYYD